MAEALNITKESQKEAADLLSKFANPRKNYVNSPSEEPVKKVEIPQKSNEDLLASIAQKQKIEGKDPNVLTNQDRKKIEDLAKNILGSDKRRV